MRIVVTRSGTDVDALPTLLFYDGNGGEPEFVEVEWVRDATPGTTLLPLSFNGPIEPAHVSDVWRGQVEPAWVAQIFDLAGAPAAQPPTIAEAARPALLALLQERLAEEPDLARDTDALAELVDTILHLVAP